MTARVPNPIGQFGSLFDRLGNPHFERCDLRDYAEVSALLARCVVLDELRFEG